MTEKFAKNYTLLAWFICSLGAIFYSYEYLLRILPSVMEADLKRHFVMSSAGFGFLSSFYYYAYVPMQIPVGILMDRYGPRILLTLACFICALGTYLFAATSYFWVAALGRFLVGLGSAFAFVGVLKLATLWLPEDKLALVAGLAAALGTVGAMVGDNLIGLMVIKVGWKHTIAYTFVFGFLLTFVLWVGIRKKRPKSQYPKKKKPPADLSKNLNDLVMIAKNRQMWLTGVYGCFVYFPTTVLAELWGIPYLQHAYHMSQEAANFGNSMIFLGFAFGAPCMGWLSDKLHRRKLPMFIGAFGALMMVLTVMYYPNLTTRTIYFLLFMLGFFYSSQAIVFALARELSPKHAAGTAMAFTNMLVMLGGMLVQPLVGWLLDFSVKHRLPNVHVNLAHLTKHVNTIYTTIDYQCALQVIPIGILLACIVTYFLKETYAKAV